MKKFNTILILIALLFLFTPPALADDALIKKVEQLESMLQLYLKENQKLKKQLEKFNKSSPNQKNTLPKKQLSTGSKKPINLFEQCTADIDNCKPITLCELATYRSVSYKTGNLVEGNEWVKGNKNKKFVDEAKRRGLSCDVENESNKLSIGKVAKTKSTKPVKTRSTKSVKHWLFDRKFTNLGPRTSVIFKSKHLKFCSGGKSSPFFGVRRDVPFNLFFAGRKNFSKQIVVVPISIKETDNRIIMTHSIFSKFLQFKGKRGAVLNIKHEFIYEKERDRVQANYWHRHVDGSNATKPQLYQYLYYCD